jgi:putative FmdB family regulatory protein
VYGISWKEFALPLYEYKCEKCGKLFEKIEPNTASEIKKCPKCGGKAPRQFAAPAIQFKGTGWYVTDYAGKNSASKSGESGESKSSESGDGDSSKKSESKDSKDSKESRESKEKSSKDSGSKGRSKKS